MDLYIFLPALFAGIVAQIIKAVIETAQNRFTWQQLINYGGMPSSHTAIVSALALSVGLNDGFHSSTFALAVVLAILVIRDATGYRWALGQHAAVINKINTDPQLPHLREKIGHRWSEVLAGLVIGLIVTGLCFVYFST